MTARSKFRAWVDRNVNLAVLVGVALTGLLVVVPSAMWLFGRPQLKVTVEQTPVRLPNSVGRNLVNAMSAIGPSEVPDTLERAIGAVVSFSQETVNFTTLRFTSSGRTPITGIDIRIPNFRDVSGWGVAGDMLTSEEVDSIMRSMDHDARTHTLFMRGPETMAPQSTFSVYLWGDWPAAFTLGRAPLTVTFDGGVATVERTTTISGVDAFIYSNAGLIVFSLIVLNLAFWTAKGFGVQSQDSEDGNTDDTILSP